MRYFQVKLTNYLMPNTHHREKALMKEMEQYKKLLAEAHREINLLKKQKKIRQRYIKLNTSVITGLDLFPSNKEVSK